MSKRSSFLKIIKQTWFVILLTSLAGFLLGVGASLMRPPEYRAALDLEVRQDIGDADAFMVVDQRNAFSDALAERLVTSDVFGAVMYGTDGIDATYFYDERDWAHGVSVHHSLYKGRYVIWVYHKDADQAVLIANAIALALTGDLSLGEYEDFHLRAWGEPIVSRWPVRPNLLANGLAGLILSLVAGVGYVLIQRDRQERRHALIHEDNA
jgi:capsular polysaccharide biosynthesis protein